MAVPGGKGLFQTADWLNNLPNLMPQPLADLARVLGGVGSPEFSFTPHNVDTAGIPSYAMMRGIPSTVYETKISVPPTTAQDVMMAGMTPPVLMGAGVKPAGNLVAKEAAQAIPKTDLLESVSKIFKQAPEWLEGFKNLREFRQANPDRFILHGTPTVYGKGDPSKVSKGGLVGPGHYTSNSGDVVGTYAFGSTGDADLNPFLDKINSARNSANKYRSEAADIRAEYGPEDLAEAKAELDQLDREAAAYEAEIERLYKDMGEKADYYNIRPNIRPAILPPTDYTPKVGDPNFHLFDFTKEAPPEDLAVLDKVIEEMRGQPSLYPMAEWGVGGNNAVLHEELTNILNGQNRANEALAKAGYDGIRHVGGRTRPMFDPFGKPVEHDVTVVFPESLMKIRNALTGDQGGRANAGYAAGLGGGAGLLALLQQFFGGNQSQGQGSW